MTWIAGGLLFILTGLLLYWLLVITEGVFLGRRVVIWLYDLTAGRYDSIKQFDEDDDFLAIGRPLAEALASHARPLLLDVASGTGRVPALLTSWPAFRGEIFALEPARKMLQQAVDKAGRDGRGPHGSLHLIQGLADPLPFADGRFHAVTCLEALEFMPSDVVALQEMVRVLKPGGLLMTTRRCGWQARLFLGRYRPVERFEQILSGLGLVEVRTLLWQMDYDMVIGKKEAPGALKVPGNLESE